jgi:hypothetical protein
VGFLSPKSLPRRSPSPVKFERRLAHLLEGTYTKLVWTNRTNILVAISTHTVHGSTSRYNQAHVNTLHFQVEHGGEMYEVLRLNERESLDDAGWPNDLHSDQGAFENLQTIRTGSCHIFSRICLIVRATYPVEYSIPATRGLLLKRQISNFSHIQHLIMIGQETPDHREGSAITSQSAQLMGDFVTCCP